MACPALATSSQFVGTTLAIIDCQGREIGAYGYGALADPGSPLAAVLSGLLVIFVALFGIRMMLGQSPGVVGLVDAIVRIGIVLTLATSWPAWRTIGYDVVIGAPREIATLLASPTGLPLAGGELDRRLARLDDGIVSATAAGTGRGEEVFNPQDPAIRGVALGDATGFSIGRVVFLVGTIGPRAIVGLGAGLLLALAPVMAGLLLFAGTVALFGGWLRALAFCALGTLALMVIEGAQTALLEPWLADVLAVRAADGLTPAAPTELTVLALAFALASFGVLWLIGRLAFHPAVARPAWRRAWTSEREALPSATVPTRTAPELPAPEQTVPSRAALISRAVTRTMQHESNADGPAAPRSAGPARSTGQASSAGAVDAPIVLLGDSQRRHARRSSAVSGMRDGR